MHIVGLICNSALLSATVNAKYNFPTERSLMGYVYLTLLLYTL